MKKYYTFLDEAGNKIEQVVAETHDEAVEKANAWKKEGEAVVTSDTDFYSEKYD